jgi:energy-coupling factor transport system ATP-binding protein
LLRVANLSKDFNGKNLFHGLNFELSAGKITGLLGKNGSGKSTLGKILLGILDPDEGAVEFPGSDQPSEGLPCHRDKVYYVFQNPDDQIVGTVVRDDVAFGCENRSLPREILIERVETSLERTGLKGLENANPMMLSGGQKQRLAIAGALAVEARVLILDEPSAMLDPDGRSQVLELLGELVREGICILLITHLPEEILLCDNLLVLRDGGMKSFEDPKRFFLDGFASDLKIDDPDEILLERMGLWELFNS